MSAERDGELVQVIHPTNLDADFRAEIRRIEHNGLDRYKLVWARYRESRNEWVVKRGFFADELDDAAELITLGTVALAQWAQRAQPAALAHTPSPDAEPLDDAHLDDDATDFAF